MPNTLVSRCFGIHFLATAGLPMLPERDLAILHSVAAYDTLTRAQITRLHFPDDDGRITRKRLKILHELGLVNQSMMRVVNPAVNGGNSAPV